jgi:hypothetical protein
MIFSSGEGPPASGGVRDEAFVHRLAHAH